MSVSVMCYIVTALFAEQAVEGILKEEPGYFMFAGSLALAALAVIFYVVLPFEQSGQVPQMITSLIENGILAVE
ncbi:MAG: hypothetical protein V1711_02975 [bacterium]